MSIDIWTTLIMSNYRCIETNNLSVAWAEAFLALMARGAKDFSPFIVNITFEDGMPIELDAIKQPLNDALGCLNENSIQTTANTIFPVSLWNISQDRTALYSRYNAVQARVMRTQQNRNGTYFQRLVSYGDITGAGTGFNQLEQVIQTYSRKNHRLSALQASIFDPKKDHSNSLRRGFPCMQHVQFVPDARTQELTVVGIYATQYIFEKAYGNYLGLYNLGRFMAHGMNLTLRGITCIASRASLGEHTKGQLDTLRRAL